MWVKLLRVQHKVTAEMWKEFFDGEQVGALVLPEHDDDHRPGYAIYVPQAKVHVAEEVLRKQQ